MCMGKTICIGLFAKKEPKLFCVLFIWANAFEERKEIIFLSSNEDNWIIRDIMEIRTATIADLAQIAAVEAECFPAAEAATKEEFAERIKYYGNHFWLMFEDEKLIAFVDGFVTDKSDLTDEMYERAEMHDENGAWQMIFGVNTIPAYRKHGYAGQLLQCAIEDARKQGRKGLVLTCKEKLIAYYAKFGFENEGISESVHGNVTWYQMRYEF
jgi:ribosomal protein S18 acetylase RimI-like enzyme